MIRRIERAAAIAVAFAASSAPAWALGGSSLLGMIPGVAGALI
jgi:hypothetical protein